MIALWTMVITLTVPTYGGRDVEIVNVPGFYSYARCMNAVAAYSKNLDDRNPHTPGHKPVLKGAVCVEL